MSEKLLTKEDRTWLLSGNAVSLDLYWAKRYEYTLQASEQRELLLREALEWYKTEAIAIAQYFLSEKDFKLDPIMASLTVLSLDGGKRANKAL